MIPVQHEMLSGLSIRYLLTLNNNSVHKKYIRILI